MDFINRPDNSNIFKSSTIYLRLFVAAVLALGFFLPILAFIPVTDDFGNPIETGRAMRVVVSVVGILCFGFAIFLCIPSLFRKQRGSESEEL